MTSVPSYIPILLHTYVADMAAAPAEINGGPDANAAPVTTATSILSFTLKPSNQFHLFCFVCSASPM